MAGAWDVVADVLGLDGPSGNDHGSSNWAAWGHQQIRSMLDTSVDPGDIGDAARAWSDQARNDVDIVTGLTRDLQQIVSGGWRGASAEAAIAALGPINDWAVSQAEIADRTTALMDASGSSAGQAKATVPPVKSHDWGQSLRSFVVGGVPGAVIDAVAQDQAQSEAHTEAVRIMNNVYSAPINDNRTEVPIYPQLADPTLQPPEQHPIAGPAPGGGVSASGGGAGSGHGFHPQPTAAHLQGVASGGGAGPADLSGGPVVLGQATGSRQPSGGQVAAGAAAAAASVPIMAPIAGSSDGRRARRDGGGMLPGVGRAAGGHVGGGGRAGGSGPGGGAHSGIGRGGSAAEFGPRRSGVAAEIAESRMGAGQGRGANAAAGRAGVGDLMAPLGGGRGKEGEETEHRRPSYLIEMDDVFTDGRKVAPPVIGEDPPAGGGSR